MAGLVAGGGMFLFFVLAVIILSRQASSGSGMYSRDRIGLVEISDVIYSARPCLEQLKALQDDDEIRGILVRINSPGGVVAASQEIFEELKKLRDAGMVIIVSMGNMATSGGYYIACAADTIMASPGTVTGSIGVIAEMMNTQELFQKIGVSSNVIKSGKFKDTGHPMRKMTSEERILMQGLVDDMYDQFLEDVSRERRLPKDEVRKIADGRILSGRQALEAGLIDTLGTFNDAVRLTAQMTGISGTPALINKRRRNKVNEWLRGFGRSLGEGLVKGFSGQSGWRILPW